MVTRPKILDNDRGHVLVMLNGRSIRGWSYQNDTERRLKMKYAREYVEGWIDGNQHGLGKLFLPEERSKQ